MESVKAELMGIAFALGVLYAKGKTITFDEAKWITVKPNGAGHTGRPALIDSATGQVLGGMGGKFNGHHISAVKNKGRNEQPGAQMQITARDPAQKAAAMNNQRIDFKTVSAPVNASAGSTATNNTVTNIENSLDKIQKEQGKVSKLALYSTVRKNLDELPANTVITSANGGTYRKNSDGSFDILSDTGEVVSKNVSVDLDRMRKDNDFNIGIGNSVAEAKGNQRSIDFGKFNDVSAGERAQRAQENARTDYFKKHENAFTDTDGHTTAGLNDISLERATSAFRNSSTDPERSAQRFREDYTETVNGLYDRLKQQAKTPEQQQYLKENFDKSKDQILKAYNDALSAQSQAASRAVVGGARTALQARKMNEKGERALEKMAGLGEAVEKAEAKLSHGIFEHSAQRTEARRKVNESAAKILNNPAASNWNQKIYSYKNGDKAVFLNNEKVVLTKEQYKALKGLSK